MESTESDKYKLREEKKTQRLERKKLKQQLKQSQEHASQPLTPKPTPVQLPPPVPYQRKWQSLFRHKPITIMTYNILAQSMCRRTVHPTAGDMLKWKTRRQMVMDEIGYYQPDLMCLQELDNYDEFYKDALAKLGYTTLFHRHETKKHGCMIGYRDTEWRQIEYRTLDYDTDESCKPTQTTGNIGQLIALAFREEGNSDKDGTCGDGGSGGGIVLGNTHLYWYPKSTYERCRQALIYRHHLFTLQNQLADKNPGADWLPLMLGDFNTQPHDPFYSLATGRSLTDEHLQDLESSRRAFDVDYVVPETTTVTENGTSSMTPMTPMAPASPSPSSSSEDNNHLMDIQYILDQFGPKEDDIRMQSVYSHHNRLWNQQQPMTKRYHDRYGVGEPDYTNYAHAFKGTLDYLFIPQQAVILDILMLPPNDIIQPALPNQHFGSDHVCLMTKILLL